MKKGKTIKKKIAITLINNENYGKNKLTIPVIVFAKILIATI